MSTPPFCQGAALLLWGWASGLLAYAVPMAVLLELRQFTRRRWNLEKVELFRVADLTTVVLVALAIYLANTVPLSHFLVSLVRLTPALFYPLVLVLSYSTWEKLPLDVIFYSLRRQPGEPGEWDLQQLYIGMCLVAMGTDTSGAALYLPLCAVLIYWALWAGRARRYAPRFTALVLLVTLAIGSAGQLSLHQLHLYVKSRTTAWLAGLMNSRIDPFRATTALGAVGRLKLSGTIVMRVDGVPRGELLYLQEASYDWLVGNDWMVMQRSFRPLQKIAQYSWLLHPEEVRGKRLEQIRIYQELADDRGLVPVPPGTLAIEDYPALDLMVNRYDSVQATGILSPPAFSVRYTGEASPGEGLEAADRRVPDDYIELMEGEVARLVPTGATPRQAVAAIRRHFAQFRYTLYQPEEIERTDPLAYFLLERRAGHCEFFASATALLLRQAGIPARYAVGYVVGEYDAFAGMHVVRRSHAHAWAEAWLDGRWEIVDTTPGTWLAIEESSGSRLQPLYDLVSNALFRFGLWRAQQRLEDYTGWLYAAAFLLTLVLIYRLSRSEQVLLEDDRDKDRSGGGEPAGASPFLRIEEHLRAGGHTRPPGEPLLHWIERIGRSELRPLVEEHYAWRFAPAGLDPQRQDALAAAVDRWLGGTA